MNINGTSASDTLTGTTTDDILDGGAGNDTIDGGANSGTWGDQLRFSGATVGVSVDLTANTASDGQGGTDTLVNIEGSYDTPFNDTFKGNAGRNYFILSGGDDTADGQGGVDTVAYFGASAGVTVNLLTGKATGSTIGTDTLTNIEAVQGSYFDDTITLSNYDGGFVLGRAGNDLLIGGINNDSFYGGSGNDTFQGGTGSVDAVIYSNITSDGGRKALTGLGVTVNLKTGTATDNWGDTDTFTSIEFVEGSALNDTLTGGNPDSDSFEGFRGLAGNDTIDGGSGYDRAYYDTSPAAVTVTLGGTSNGTAADGWGGTDTLINIEGVRGSSFVDTLTGSDSGSFEDFEGRAGDDIIDGKGGQDRATYGSSPAAVTINITTGVAQDGWGGSDTLTNIEDIRGSNFNDTLTGDAGNNLLEGMAGDDVMDGGAGFDTARYDNSTGAVTVNLATGTATGGSGNDTLSNFEAAWGSGYADTLTGNAQNNDLRGGAGDDVIDGGAGIDSASYTTARSNHTLTKTSTGFTVTSTAEGTDTLTNIERLTFSDQKLAFDLTGSAGVAAKVLGALMGSAALQNQALVGQIIGLTDGGLTLVGLAELAVSSGAAASLAGGADNTAFAKLVMRGVLGSDANADVLNALVGALGTGQFTQASLLATVADLDLNTANIGLVGLSQNGLAYF